MPASRKRSSSRGSPDSGATEAKASKANDGSRDSSSNRDDSNSNRSSVTVVNTIIPTKSPNDPNEYKIIKLSNGLTAVLISRKSSKSCGPGASVSVAPNRRKKFNAECVLTSLGFLDLKPSPLNFPSMVGIGDGNNSDLDSWEPLENGGSTSVALVVNFGKLNDPCSIQGLAHLMEHMVHYGSNKYPGEHMVDEVLTNFGIHNAFTSNLLTCYYNKISEIIMDRNMDLFTEMLTHPLFDVDMVNREVQAVDNEFHLKHIFWRRDILEAQVSIKNQSHPMARFTCGCLESLGNGQLEGSRRVAKQMKEIHKQNYVASAMTLAINSRKPLDKLEKMAIKCFSKLLQGERKIRHETDKADSEGPKVQLPDKEIAVYMKGLTCMSELTLKWILPASIWLNKKNEKTMEVIHHLLSGTQAGGLQATLREEELIWRIAVNYSLLPYGTILELNVILTQKGTEYTDAIQQAIFQFINKLQAISEGDMTRIFDEMCISALRHFKFGSHRLTLGHTIRMAMQLQHVQDPAELLTVDSWSNAMFNYKSIVNTLGLLKPCKNLVVFHTLRKQDSLEGKMAELKKTCKSSPIQIKTASYTKAKYFVVHRTSLSSLNNSGSPNSFQLPCANEFLKDELQKCEMYRNQSLKSGSGDLDLSTCLAPPPNFGDIKPQGLKYKSHSDLKDMKDGIPKISGGHFGHSNYSQGRYLARLRIDFLNASTLAFSPRGYVLCWLWTLAVQQKMQTSYSKYKQAGLSFNMGQWSSSRFGFLGLTIHGFPTHFGEVVEEILTSMLGKEPVSQLYFNLAKDWLRFWFEYCLADSGTISQEVIDKALFSQSHMKWDLLGLVDSLQLEDLHSLISSFRKSTFAVIYMWGNLPLSFFNKVASLLDRMNFAPNLDNDPRIFKIDKPIPRSDFYCPGEQCVRIISESSLNFTCSVTNIYILGRYYEGATQSEYFDAAMRFIQHFAFLYLRTQNQLGYVVYADEVDLMSYSFMAFKVHVTATTHKYSTCQLDAHIDAFLSAFGDFIKNISDEIFDTMKIEANIRMDVSKKKVGNWFSSRFGKSFRNSSEAANRCQVNGIRKLSIQVLPNPNHPNPVVDTPLPSCSCCRCAKIKEWKYGTNQGSTLKYAVGEKGDKYFLSF